MDMETLGIAQAYVEEKIKEAGGMTSEGVVNIVKESVGTEVNAYLGENQTIAKKEDLVCGSQYVPVELTQGTTGSYYKRGTNELVEATWACAMNPIEVTENEQYKIGGKSSYGAVLYNIADAEGNIIYSFPEKSGATTIHDNVVLTIPSGGKYLYCNSAYISGNPTNLYKEQSIYVSTVAKDVNNKIMGTAENPLDNMVYHGGMLTIFDSITCIGDSLTAGCFEHNNSGSTVWTTIEKYSYPTQVAKMTGCEVKNYGRSGRTALDTDVSWLAWADEQGWLTTEDKTDAYIIALGTNDIGVKGGFTGDVTTDIAESYVDNAETSVGGYDKIIRRILEIQPRAKIFCVCLPHTRNTEETIAVANTAIKAIASLYPNNCYVLDLETYYVQRSEIVEYKAKYYNNGHRNALGYKELAQTYVNYIDWIIRNNTNEFLNVQFVETDYSWT